MTAWTRSLRPSFCKILATWVLAVASLITTGCPACCPESAARPGAAAQRPASGGRGGCAALAATRAPGHEPHDDEDGHRDQPDDEKRLERCNDPARSREGKPYGEDRAEDCPDDPAHVPSMRPEPPAGGGRAGRPGPGPGPCGPPGVPGRDGTWSQVVTAQEMWGELRQDQSCRLTD